MNTKSSKSNPFTHPLNGSSISNLVRLITDNYPIPFNHWSKLIAAFISSGVRLPFRILENVTTQLKIRNLKMESPVFIIGHWRSGTTHIGNLLSKDPYFGYVSPIATGLPWEMLTLGKLFRPLLEKSIPRDRLIDRVPVTPVSPQEDEFGIANMFHVSFLHGLYFPENFEKNFNRGLFFDSCSVSEVKHWKKIHVYFLKKVYLYQNKRRLVDRNPVYTARVALLRELWPDARFIHIHRSPYRIFNSMKNYFNKLFPALALQPYDHLDLEDFILKTYSRMMDALIRDSSDLSDEVYIDVSFEELEKEPIEVLNKIYDQLHLPDFKKAEPYFQSYLDSISNYKKNIYHQDQVDAMKVEKHWGEYIKHWKY